MRAFMSIPIPVLLLCVSHAMAADIPIEQLNHNFSQTAVRLSSGDTLVVHNADGMTHDLNVVDEDGEPQDLGMEPPGKTMRISFANTGRYTVRCALTPGMRMAVIVN